MSWQSPQTFHSLIVAGFLPSALCSQLNENCLPRFIYLMKCISTTNTSLGHVLVQNIKNHIFCPQCPLLCLNIHYVVLLQWHLFFCIFVVVHEICSTVFCRYQRIHSFSHIILLCLDDSHFKIGLISPTFLFLLSLSVHPCFLPALSSFFLLMFCA